MLHLRGGSRQEKYEHALLEAGQLIGGGADAVIVENYFGDYEDMETVLEAFSREKVDFVYGVNALHKKSLPQRGRLFYGESPRRGPGAFDWVSVRSGTSRGRGASGARARS